MYIWTQDGTNLINLDRYDRIEFKNETEELRRRHPATKDELYVIRVRNGADTGIAVGVFDDANEAWNCYVDIETALESGANLISLYQRDPREIKEPMDRGR